jgi:hypothetical protein
MQRETFVEIINTYERTMKPFVLTALTDWLAARKIDRSNWDLISFYPDGEYLGVDIDIGRWEQEIESHYIHLDFVFGDQAARDRFITELEEQDALRAS